MRSALIIGAGSYVTGDSFGPGVVLPSLMELKRRCRIDEIIIGVREKRDDSFWSKVDGLGKIMGVKAEVREFVFTEARDLEELDLSNMAAFISVPDANHGEYLDLFVDRGVPTWVVKPLCGDGTKALEIAGKAKNHGVPLWVDYHKRFDENNLMLKEVVDSGERGRMLLYSVKYSQPATIPLSDLRAWSSDVDVFQYIGCHYVDQVFFLHPGSIPERVSATGIPGRLKTSGGPEYDIVHAIVDFRLPGGEMLRGDFNIAWNDPEGASAKSDQRVEAQFEDGRVIADQKRRGFELWGDKKVEEINPYFFQFYRDPIQGDIRRPEGYGFKSIANFIESVDKKTSIESTGLPWAWNSCGADLVIDGARASMRAGGEWRPVSWPLPPLYL